MIDLQGRLLALDPSANETLKVVSYFDSLAQAHAGVEAIVRAATVLAGCGAGVTDGTPAGTLRVSATGTATRRQLPADGEWPTKAIDGQHDSRVWLERVGPQHVNDEMVLERLALSISIAQYRPASSVAPSAMEVLIDKNATDDERLLAATRLRLDTGQAHRVVAAPAALDTNSPETSAIVWTSSGMVRATLGVTVLPSRGGVGLSQSIVTLPNSLASAVTALQLTDHVQPILWADELGSLLMLAGQTPIGADAERLYNLVTGHRWAEETMAALGRHSSVRNAAEALGVHHSTLQARIETLNADLQFDVVPQAGRTRMLLALSIYRLANAKF